VRLWEALAQPGFMPLKGSHDLLQFFLGKIDQLSLRQVWATALERQILVDKLFECFQHLGVRLRHFILCRTQHPARKHALQIDRQILANSFDVLR
jgi:hypothetical protein